MLKTPQYKCKIQCFYQFTYNGPNQILKDGFSLGNKKKYCVKKIDKIWCPSAPPGCPNNYKQRWSVLPFDSCGDLEYIQNKAVSIAKKKYEKDPLVLRTLANELVQKMDDGNDVNDDELGIIVCPSNDQNRLYICGLVSVRPIIFVEDLNIDKCQYLVDEGIWWRICSAGIIVDKRYVKKAIRLQIGDIILLSTKDLSKWT